MQGTALVDIIVIKRDLTLWAKINKNYLTLLTKIVPFHEKIMHVLRLRYSMFYILNHPFSFKSVGAMVNISTSGRVDI